MNALLTILFTMYRAARSEPSHLHTLRLTWRTLSPPSIANRSTSRLVNIVVKVLAHTIFIS